MSIERKTFLCSLFHTSTNWMPNYSFVLKVVCWKLVLRMREKTHGIVGSGFSFVYLIFIYPSSPPLLAGG